MRRCNHPPLVVLFDLLFMLLFVSVLNQERVLSIHLPRDRLPEDVAVVTGQDDRALAQAAKALAAGRGGGGFGFLLRCEGQPECRALGDGARLMLPEALYDEISRIAMTPFADGKCRRLVFKFGIDKTGRAALDFERLGVDNPCLKRVYGFEDWVSHRLDLD